MGKNLQDLKKFIDANNKRPTEIKYIKKEKFINNKEKQEYEEMEINIKKNNYLAHWLSDQIRDYNQNKMTQSRTKKWKEFTEDDKYNKYFMTSDKQWFIKFEKMKEFIRLNNKKPPKSGIVDNQVDEEIKTLGGWLHMQLSNYKAKKSTIYKNEEIRKIWENTMNDDFFGKCLKSE